MGYFVNVLLMLNTSGLNPYSNGSTTMGHFDELTSTKTLLLS